ncbi:hypothetical protein PK35_16350, partial [Tamlana nanhaiensis]
MGQHSGLTFPTTYTNLGSGNSGTANINVFDVAGTYTVNFRRRRIGNLLLSCDTANDAINIFISTPISGANAGSPQTFVCGQVGGTIAGSAILPGETSVWSQVSGPDAATIADVYARTTTISGLVPGEYVFRYTVTAGPNCTPPQVSDTSVFVSPLDNSPVEAGANQTVCFNAPVQLAADPGTDSQTGTWTASDPSVVFSDVNDPNAIATGFVLPSTAYTLTWSLLNDYLNCGPAATDDVIITTSADESPTIADAGTDFCFGPGVTTIPNLSGNAPDIDETGTWTQISGPSTVTFTNPNSETSEVTGLIDGQYEFQWEIAYSAPPPNACPSTLDTVEVVVADTNITIDAGPDQLQLCLDPVLLSFTMNATPAPDGGQGTWNLVSGLGGYTVDDVNSPTATFSDLLDGTYVFEWVIDYGNCVASATPDQVTIEVGIPPTQAVIQGGNQVICAATNTNITADPLVNPDAENGTWTVVSGPNTPTIDNPGDNSINVTNLETGSYVFRWTTVGSSPFCPNSSDDVTVDVFAPAAPMADQELCLVSSVFLEATQGTTGIWSIVSVDGDTTPGVIAPYSPTQSPSNSNTANAPVDAGSVYVFEYTTDYAGSGAACNNTEQVTVTVSDGPSEDADAGLDQDICIADTTTASLTAGNIAIPGDVTSEWRLLSQPGGATVGFTTPNNSTTTDVTGLTVPGIYIVELNFVTGFCTDNADIVRIEVFEAPTPVEAGPNQPLACQQNTQLNATTPTVGIGQWTFENPGDDPSGGIVIIDSPNNPQTTLSNIPDDIGNDGVDDVYVLTWTVTSGPLTSGACAPQSDTVTLTYTGAPPSQAIAGPDQEYCDNTQAFLDATPLAVGTGTWTQTAGAPATITAPNNPKSLVLGLSAGTYQFTWTAVGGGCTSVDTMEILIYSDPITAEAGPDQSLPQFSAVTLDATPATSGIGTWTQVSGPSTVNFINENDPTTTVAGTTVGTYVFRWTVSNGTCSDASDDVTITINPISDLELTKTVSNSNVNVGDIVTFTVSIFNNDANATNADATGVNVEDVLPLGFSLVSGTVSNSGTFDLGTQTITWTNLSIANGDTLNLTFDATVNATGSYVNSAQITASDNLDPDSDPNTDATVDEDNADGDDNPNTGGDDDDEDTASVTIQSADLSLQKTVLPTSVSVGDTVVFTITVSNGGADTATNVEVVDQLPSGYAYQSDDASGNYNPATGVWTTGSVTAALDQVLNITAIVNAPSGTLNEYLNIAEITNSDQADPNSTPNNDNGDQSEDDEDNAEITLELADLQITKSVLPLSGSVGDTVTFSIFLENFGPGDATGVAIEDLLPSGFDVVPGTISNSGVFILGNKSIVWSNLDLGNGLSRTLTYDAIVNDSGNYTNNVQITASDLDDPDSDPTTDATVDEDNADGDNDPTTGGDDDDEDTVTFIIEEADLNLAKTVMPSNATVGDTVTFTIIVDNDGANDATNVEVVDQLPAGFTYVGDDSSGDYDSATGLWTIATITNGSSATLNITATVNAPTGAAGEYNNIAEITASDQVDPDSDVNNDDGDQSEDDEDNAELTLDTSDLSISKA